MSILSIILTFALLYTLIGFAYMHFRFGWVKEAYTDFMHDNPEHRDNVTGHYLSVVVIVVSWPWLIWADVRSSTKAWAITRKLDRIKGQMENNPTPEQKKLAREFLDSIKQAQAP